MGGTLDGFCYAFGDCDLYLIAELTDEATAMAVSMNIGAAGALDVSMTVLSARKRSTRPPRRAFRIECLAPDQPRG